MSSTALVSRVPPHRECVLCVRHFTEQLLTALYFIDEEMKMYSIASRAHAGKWLSTHVVPPCSSQLGTTRHQKQCWKVRFPGMGKGKGHFSVEGCSEGRPVICCCHYRLPDVQKSQGLGFEAFLMDLYRGLHFCRGFTVA